MSRAWVDSHDDDQASVPAFLMESAKTPAWAAGDAQMEDEQHDAGDRPAGKRRRNEDLDDALASTVPLLDSKHQRTSNAKPTVLSVFPMPRDIARAMQWHSNSQLCAVAGTQSIYLFHSAGKYVEQVAKISTGARVDDMVLAASGDEALVTPHEAYVPSLVSLSTEKVTPLTFLDTRENFAYRHDYRNDTHGKAYNFIRKVCVRQNDTASRWVGVAHGNCLVLGALGSASVIQKIHTSDPIVDVAFTSQHEVSIAMQDRLLVYDVRKSAKQLSAMVDEGSIGISGMGFSTAFTALASKSGVVNIYQKGATTPMKTLKNLTTRVSMLAFGEGRQGPVLVAATSEQKNGVRLVKLPGGVVVPSFPDVGARHGFLSAVALAPQAPILSLGERGKVTNYVI